MRRRFAGYLQTAAIVATFVAFGMALARCAAPRPCANTHDPDMCRVGGTALAHWMWACSTDTQCADAEAMYAEVGALAI